MIKSYGKENYVSVWIGNCKTMDLFNEYIEIQYPNDDEDDEVSRFELGKNFGIRTYEEAFSLVNYCEVETNNLKELLNTGAPDYVEQYFIQQNGQCLQEKFNCCIMFYDMDYSGNKKEIINEKYGKFVFLGSMVSDKFDML